MIAVMSFDRCTYEKPGVEAPGFVLQTQVVNELL